MSTQLSSNNPFRANAQTPANTGSLDPASHSQPPPITAPEAQRPNNAGNPAAPSDPPSTASNHANPSSVQTRVESATPPPPLSADDFGLDTELPPAYTPSADARQGESTLEYGPSRPFQQAPQQQIRPPQQQFLTPQPTGQSTSSWSSGNGAQSNYRSRSRGPLGLLTQFADELERQLTVTAREMSRPTTYRQVSPAIVVPARTGGGGWSAYPGQRPPQSYPNNAPVPRHSTGAPLPPPPPSHPQHARSVSSPHSSHLDVPSPTRAPTSDFARDFYASGSDSASLTDGMANMNIDAASRSAPNLPGSPPAQTSYGPPPGPPPGVYAPPPGPPPGVRSEYAPPPGPPPNHPPALPPRPRTTSPSRGESQNAGPSNDGRPTLHPTPGHPLMRDGRVLVYPNGFECEKCNNTGYKHADPMHPCKTCWRKYAKAFTGPLTWASWGEAVSTSDDTHSGLRRSATSAIGRGGRRNASHHSTTLQRPLPYVRGPHQRSATGYPEPQGPGMSTSEGFVSAPQNSYGSAPPLVYSSGGPYQSYGNGNTVTMISGDPRLGGRLCWNCSGRGLKSVLGGLLGEEECFVCRGIGRIF